MPAYDAIVIGTGTAGGYLADLCVPKIRFCNIGGEGHRE